MVHAPSTRVQQHIISGLDRDRSAFGRRDKRRRRCTMCPWAIADHSAAELYCHPELDSRNRPHKDKASSHTCAASCLDAPRVLHNLNFDRRGHGASLGAGT